LWRGERYRHERIRLAYVSADLGFHPVSYLLAELFEIHDRRQFELTAVALRPPGATAFDARVHAAFDRFIDASALSDLEIARLMHEHEVDLAIDLMGYTGQTRIGIFAHRPAPVQVAYLGYAGTLATGYIDYLIADPTVIPAAVAAHYSEQVVHLPHTMMPRDRSVVPAQAPTRKDAGLPERGFVFCCFNNAYKLNPPVFDVWMRLARAVPDSVLWLTDPGAEGRKNLVREAKQRGLDGRRLIFAGRTAKVEDHLARIALADLFLDTLPYNAHTTASDALWMGVPLLTCTGEAFASRVAASLLAAAGLPKLITKNLNEYEALALRLAGDPVQMARLRARLAASRAGGQLFDTASFCRSLEQAYVHMHERNAQGLAPAAFAVEA
jgi:predicted O-linked N-acetylglucosamine transferase (SPINDLY family)